MTSRSTRSPWACSATARAAAPACRPRSRTSRRGGCACCTTRSFSDDPTRLLRLARYAAGWASPIEPAPRVLAAGRRRPRRSGHGERRPARAELRLLAARARPGGRPERPERARHRRARWPRASACAIPSRPAARWPCCRRRRSGRPRARRRAMGVRRRAGRDARPAGLRGRPAGAILAAAAAHRRSRRSLGPPGALGFAAAVGRRTRGGGPGRRAGPGRAARGGCEDLRRVKLEIDGRDLLAAGVPSGPAIGRGCARPWRPSSTAGRPAVRPSSRRPSGRVGARLPERDGMSRAPPEPFYLLRRAVRDRSARGPRGVHHPPGRISQGPTPASTSGA